jgi:hypothetical protein
MTSGIYVYLERSQNTMLRNLFIYVTEYVYEIARFGVSYSGFSSIQNPLNNNGWRTYGHVQH